MRVEILEELIRDTEVIPSTDPKEPPREIHREMVKGDTLTVSDAYGARLCKLGWAKDLDGNVETGERKPGAETLVVQKLTTTTRGRIRG